MEPTTSVATVAIWKFGLLKLVGFGSALLGAAMMAIFRPPKTRRELFYQGAVALGASFLFGGTAVQVVATWTGWIVLHSAPFEDVIQFYMAVYGLIGSAAWGVFGGFSVLRDKFGSDPVQLAKDVKDLM